MKKDILCFITFEFFRCMTRTLWNGFFKTKTKFRIWSAIKYSYSMININKIMFIKLNFLYAQLDHDYLSIFEGCFKSSTFWNI